MTATLTERSVEAIKERLTRRQADRQQLQAVHEEVSDVQFELCELTDAIRELALAVMGLEQRHGVESSNLDTAMEILNRVFPLPVIDLDEADFEELGAR